MPMTAAAKDELISELLDEYQNSREKIDVFRDQVITALDSSSELSTYVHFLKSRAKDPEHLREKLLRKIASC